MREEWPKPYHYIGPHELHELLSQPSDRTCIRHADDIRSWMMTTRQQLSRDHSVVATYVVDTDGRLWIADRHSEHVACAAGRPVLAAGEMTFHVEKHQIHVTEITNQSTGYCPEPESWPVVAATLRALAIEYPPTFTTTFIFRRCTTCSTINIVKEQIFECAVCETALSREWNF